MKGIVLIPAYKPNEELVKLVDEIAESGLHILVVNDGSGEEFTPIFEAIQPKATVLAHPQNKGKGSALKTGIAYIQARGDEYDYFITADADGQHKSADVLRIREKLETGERMVLTVRNLRGKIPFRSRFGNTLSSFICAMLTGRYYDDNQSGLRGFSVGECGWLLQVKGDHYDYEMNVIYHADRQKVPMATLDIAAVYIDGNKSSHFNPVADTLRIYKRLFSKALGSLLPIAAIWLALLFSPLYAKSEGAVEHLIFSLPLIGCVGVLLNVSLTNLVFLRYIKTRDYGKIFFRTFLRFLCYTGLCYLTYALLPAIPFCVSYSVWVLLLIYPEYLIVKLCHKLKNK